MGLVSTGKGETQIAIDGLAFAFLEVPSLATFQVLVSYMFVTSLSLYICVPKVTIIVPDSHELQ